MFEKYLDINTIHTIRARSLVYFGCGAIQKMNDIAAELKTRGIDKVMILTSKNAYKGSGAWEPTIDALEKNGVEYVHFDGVIPNPTTDSIDEAVQVARDFGARALIGIGGGSPIDVAKSVAILLEYPNETGESLYCWKFTPEKAVPIVAINLTHGTGTECDRVAVASVTSKNFKPAIAYECIYPEWAIDDPQLMLTLPAKHILFTSIDAVNHVVEAATTKCTNPFAITLAREVIALVHENLPKALADPRDVVPRFNLAYAALLAGISFDNGFLHLTHALEHPLSAVKPELTHGLGLAMLLPAVVNAIYPSRGAVLADILSPIVPGLSGCACEAETAAKAVEDWLFSLGSDHKLSDEGFTVQDIAKLTELTQTTPSLPVLLSVAPVEATTELISKIYADSLNRME
ncbi:MAG: iron-containing alcohol dehydrogenase [Planctomycetaceae bacterium]|nr:iron-containing alcohol dehydrogenase [Planctomycetaceae bacterium]MBQ2822887.1 iron-containing alcohol dehydrogenase [Thermoguttaceae bacterium]